MRSLSILAGNGLDRRPYSRYVTRSVLVARVYPRTRVSLPAPKEPSLTEIPRVPGRAYQVTRDPERLLIEERAEALSLLGYHWYWTTYGYAC